MIKTSLAIIGVSLLAAASCYVSAQSEVDDATTAADHTLRLQIGTYYGEDNPVLTYAGWCRDGETFGDRVTPAEHWQGYTGLYFNPSVYSDPTQRTTQLMGIYGMPVRAADFTFTIDYECYPKGGIVRRLQKTIRMIITGDESVFSDLFLDFGSGHSAHLPHPTHAHENDLIEGTVAAHDTKLGTLDNRVNQFAIPTVQTLQVTVVAAGNTANEALRKSSTNLTGIGNLNDHVTAIAKTVTSLIDDE